MEPMHLGFEAHIYAGAPEHVNLLESLDVSACDYLIYSCKSKVYSGTGPENTVVEIPPGHQIELIELCMIVRVISV